VTTCPATCSVARVARFGAALALAAAAGALSPGKAVAQSSYPMIMSARPLAVQVGQTGEVEVSARYNLYGAYQVFVTPEGVTGEVVVPEMAADQPPPAAKPEMPKIKVRFTAAPDAVPGPRSFRLATPQGASTVGQLVVVREAVMVEAADNDAMATAQGVTLPATLCGAIEKAEDVDFFKFTLAEAGAWTFHVHSSRSQDRIHDLQTHSDPILTLRNAAGTVLATSDNYFFADPLLHFNFTDPGDYYLDIRDVRYQGNADWQYSIEASNRPLVTNVFPSRVTPGTATRLDLVGFHLPGDRTTLLTLPAEMPEGPVWLNLPLGESLAPAPLVISRLPGLIEAAGDNGTPAAAPPIEVPLGISGRISEPGDVDCYRFEARQGERFSFEVLARRHQSALDSVLRIVNEPGAVLVENDDLSTGRHSHADSMIENWTAPADGSCAIELSDLHQRGGPEYVYFLKVTRSEPYFTLDVDTDKTLLSAGTAGAIFVRVYRKNGFAGEVQLAIEGLPPGVTASCGRILAGSTDGCIILEAAPDAGQGAANVRISGSATVEAAEAGQPPLELAAMAQPMQEVYMPGGGRNHYPVDVHTVSVGDMMDLKAVTLSTTAVSLKPGESQKIDVTIDRREGFSGNVTLDCLFQHLGSIYGNSLPPGVTIDEKNSQIALAGDQSQGHITLAAAADAKPVENQQVAVMANVSINFVMKYTYCGPPVIVSVLPP
jgi:hypothetical protein